MVGVAYIAQVRGKEGEERGQGRKCCSGVRVGGSRLISQISRLSACHMISEKPAPWVGGQKLD